MRFSEAMALGLPEIQFNNSLWLDISSRDGKCYGCLVGAALFAEGCRKFMMSSDFYEHWPWMRSWRAPKGLKCMVGDCQFDGFQMPTICTHLAMHYERGELRADQIVDFIRSIEPDQPAQTTETASAKDELAHSPHLRGLPLIRPFYYPASR